MGSFLMAIGYIILFCLLEEMLMEGRRVAAVGTKKPFWRLVCYGFWALLGVFLVIYGLEIQGMGR